MLDLPPDIESQFLKYLYIKDILRYYQVKNKSMPQQIIKLLDQKMGKCIEFTDICYCGSEKGYAGYLGEKVNMMVLRRCDCGTSICKNCIKKCPSIGCESNICKYCQYDCTSCARKLCKLCISQVRSGKKVCRWCTPFYN